jgi:hypothetical protein
MATKQFKIGEYAVGGIIKVDITGKVIQVKCLDWTSKKEVNSGTATTEDPDAYRKLWWYLGEVTSSYYADKVLEWIKSKVKFQKELY